MELPARYWNQIVKTETCWLWVGSGPSRKSGKPTYGAIMVDCKNWATHRLMWTAVHGPIPEGIGVLHRCDTPRCVNPDHLFLGSHKDNMADAKAKKRFCRRIGSESPRALVNEEQVLEIRKHVAARTKTRKQIRQEYGISLEAIWCIVSGRTWKHVPMPERMD